MKTVLVILLVTGYVHSAIVDSSKSPPAKKGDWDDEDSMTLLQTTTTVKPSSQDATTTTLPSSAEDQITEEQQRPRFLSLIPPGTHKVNTLSKSDQEDPDQFKYRIYPNTVPTTTAASESEQDDSTSGSSTTQSSSDEEETSQDSVLSDEQGTTERSRIMHIQLGKIPLTYEIIPLLPPREEKQQLLGREDTKPISFFPPEEMMTEKAKMLKKEQQEQQEQTEQTRDDISTTEIITGRPVPDLQELPPVPLSYMVPPKQDGEQDSLWHLYPQPTTTNDDRYLELPQTTTNPLLERLKDLLQKAKRHSLEMETTTNNDNEGSSTTPENDASTQGAETTTAERIDDSTEDDDKADTTQENLRVTDPFIPLSEAPEDSNGDLNPSSPAPIPEEPTDDIFSTRGPTILYPRPNIPEIQDYQDYSPESSPLLPYPPSSSPLPPIPNSINVRPNPMDQYFSDYSNLATAQQHQQQQQFPLNPYYSQTSNQASILQRRLLMSSLLHALSSTPSTTTTTTTLPPPPSRPIYISPDSYWPNKYYNENRGAGNFGSGSRTGSNGYYNNNNNIYTPDYNSNYNTNYNYDPFTRSSPTGGFNNDYGYYQRPRPQRQSVVYPSTSTAIPIEALNSILTATSSEEPSYSYGSPAENLNYGFSSYGSPYYSRNSDNSYYSRNSDNSYYSTRQSASPYVLNYRPTIPYRPYPITSSDLVNQLMYAPLYPYERYRRFPVQPEYF